jgi:hypothetical protein
VGSENIRKTSPSSLPRRFAGGSRSCEFLSTGSGREKRQAKPTALPRLSFPGGCVCSWSQSSRLTPDSGVLRDQNCTAQGCKVNCVIKLTFGEMIVLHRVGRGGRRDLRSLRPCRVPVSEEDASLRRAQGPSCPPTSLPLFYYSQA